jgi:hypothetical protein
VLFLGGSTPTFTAPVSNPRIDLVTADSSGTIAIVTGAENASPAAPSYPANKMVLCEVYHVVGETALYDFANQQAGQGYVYNDVRPFLEPAYISASSQVASGLFIPDPGSEVQGNTLYYNGSAWVLLAPGTSGQFLKTNGPSANPSWTSFPLALRSGVATAPGSSGTQTCTHALFRTPIWVKIHAKLSAQSTSNVWIGISSDGDSNNVCSYISIAGGSAIAGTDGSNAVNITIGSTSYTATITFDSTNIYIAWTKTGSINAPAFLWEVVG